MITTLDNTAVKSFLKIAKELIRRKKYKIIPRTYNLDYVRVNYKEAIIRIGIIRIESIWNYILELKEEDCFRISKDIDLSRDTNSEVFEFIKVINGKRVYIKLTLKNDGDDKVICLSFHESTR